MRFSKLFWIPVAALACLSACAAPAAAPTRPAQTPTLCPTPVGAKSEACALNPGATAQFTPAGLGAQGPAPAVKTEPEITAHPLNLDQPGDTLRVELSLPATWNPMDLATLTNDSGLTVHPSAWKPAAGKNSQVTGELSFPLRGESGDMLAGTRQLTLILASDTGGEAQRFSWPVSQN